MQKQVMVVWFAPDGHPEHGVEWAVNLLDENRERTVKTYKQEERALKFAEELAAQECAELISY